MSEGERAAAKAITAWARKARVIKRVEMLGYCDGRTSVDWISGTGGRVMNLLVKGSEKHCRQQLGLSPEEHRAAVARTVRAAREPVPRRASGDYTNAGAYWRKAWDEAASPPGEVPPTPAYAREQSRSHRDIRYLT